MLFLLGMIIIWLSWHFQNKIIECLFASKYLRKGNFGIPRKQNMLTKYSVLSLFFVYELTEFLFASFYFMSWKEIIPTHI